MTGDQSPALQGIHAILIGLTEEGHGDETNASVGYGLTLAAAAAAHVTVQAASRRIDVAGIMFPGLVRGLVAEENLRLDTLAQAVACRAAGDAAMAGIACTTAAPSLSHVDILASLTLQARLHDLTILDAEPVAMDGDRDLIEAVLFGSGRPVIVVPPEITTFSAKRIVVAWDGSARAARALNDAMPFLLAAEAVEITCVVEEREIADAVAGADIAPHLTRHGVAVTVNDLPRNGTIADTLRLEAGQFRADMLVLGAFGHSPLRERLFGGVTQSLLQQSSVPLFIAH